MTGRYFTQLEAQCKFVVDVSGGVVVVYVGLDRCFACSIETSIEMF